MSSALYNGVFPQVLEPALVKFMSDPAVDEHYLMKLFENCKKFPNNDQYACSCCRSMLYTLILDDTSTKKTIGNS